jgi:23S rRNA pseudouridine1911/1915/1917 synthase
LKNSKFIISASHDGGEALDLIEMGPPIEIRQLVFSQAQHAQRIDHALVNLVPEFSRSYLQQMIASQGVTVNGAVWRKPATRVKAGDVGTIELRPTPQSQAFKPEIMTLQPVYEDEHLLIIDKPVGLVVHPAPGHWTGTLLNGLLAHDTNAMHLPRAGIVHRLDMDTSGLMVIARSRAAMDALIQLIAARELSRQYLALAHHPWVGSPLREVNMPIGRDPRNRLKMAVVELEKTPGKLARTDIELLQNCQHGCYVRCTLHTGRTHQIRVHMASIGHPLVADKLYGGLNAGSMQRQALHAFRLAFVHPFTRKSLVFQAALPSDFHTALNDWGISLNSNSLPNRPTAGSLTS